MMRCLSVFSILELIMLIIKSYISKAITYKLQSYIVPDTLFLYFVSSKTVLSIAIHNKRRYIQNKDWKLNGAEARDVDWMNDIYVSFNTLFLSLKVIINRKKTIHQKSLNTWIWCMNFDQSWICFLNMQKKNFQRFSPWKMTDWKSLKWI